ncbi:hypothetical protein HXX76_007629 [Chlamydomonas incerta]|uniref:Uncharacterized protein n=1 Tax=Chlamydomonas incerta TaxID=51695 RepID=A0A835W0I0_CHLIN|nr:hypothetical protein HXX76_007629 [Chlamydomonas incerta]|eukprot:KAG2434740.1 hypothetical protein HXX76_007629 [Chlamydomonas incerta]
MELGPFVGSQNYINETDNTDIVPDHTVTGVRLAVFPRIGFQTIDALSVEWVAVSKSNSPYTRTYFCGPLWFGKSGQPWVNTMSRTCTVNAYTAVARTGMDPEAESWAALAVTLQGNRRTSQPILMTTGASQGADSRATAVVESIGDLQSVSVKVTPRFQAEATDAWRLEVLTVSGGMEGAPAWLDDSQVFCPSGDGWFNRQQGWTQNLTRRCTGQSYRLQLQIRYNPQLANGYGGPMLLYATLVGGEGAGSVGPVALPAFTPGTFSEGVPYVPQGALFARRISPVKALSIQVLPGAMDEEDVFQVQTASVCVEGDGGRAQECVTLCGMPADQWVRSGASSQVELTQECHVEELRLQLLLECVPGKRMSGGVMEVDVEGAASSTGPLQLRLVGQGRCTQYPDQTTRYEFWHVVKLRYASRSGTIGVVRRARIVVYPDVPDDPDEVLEMTAMAVYWPGSPGVWLTNPQQQTFSAEAGWQHTFAAGGTYLDSYTFTHHSDEAVNDKPHVQYLVSVEGDPVVDPVPMRLPMSVGRYQAASSGATGRIVGPVTSLTVEPEDPAAAGGEPLPFIHVANSVESKYFCADDEGNGAAGSSRLYSRCSVVEYGLKGELQASAERLHPGSYYNPRLRVELVGSHGRGQAVFSVGSPTRTSVWPFNTQFRTRYLGQVQRMIVKVMPAVDTNDADLTWSVAWAHVVMQRATALNRFCQQAGASSSAAAAGGSSMELLPCDSDGARVAATALAESIGVF